MVFLFVGSSALTGGFLPTRVFSSAGPKGLRP
jgi:hypothetical protein